MVVRVPADATVTWGHVMIGDYRRPRLVDGTDPLTGRKIVIELPPLPRPPLKLGEPIWEPWEVWEPERFTIQWRLFEMNRRELLRIVIGAPVAAIAGSASIVAIGDVDAFRGKDISCWDIIEYADWEHCKDYMAIGRKLRLEFGHEFVVEAETFYRHLLREIEVVLEDHAERKTGNRHAYYGVSDDGFWDLRAHIIGLGRQFYASVLDDPEIAKRIADERSYVENFGYVFNYAKKTG